MSLGVKKSAVFFVFLWTVRKIQYILALFFDSDCVEFLKIYELKFNLLLHFECLKWKWKQQ